MLMFHITTEVTKGTRESTRKLDWEIVLFSVIRFGARSVLYQAELRLKSVHLK